MELRQGEVNDWYYQPTIYLKESGSFLASWGPSLTTRVKTGGMEEGNEGEKRRRGGGGGLRATLLSSINKKRSRILTQIISQRRFINYRDKGRGWRVAWESYGHPTL